MFWESKEGIPKSRKQSRKEPQRFERYISNGGREDLEEYTLHLFCHILPSEKKEKKRKQLLLALSQEEGELWLEPGLAEKMAYEQPQASKELLLFRLMYQMEQWHLKTGWKPESAVLWEATAIDHETECFLLAHFIGELNHVTVICNRQEPYEELTEEAWQEYGLPVRFLNRPIREYPYGAKTLVINMEPGRRIRPGLFSEETRCLDICAGMPKFLDTIARNVYNS